MAEHAPSSVRSWAHKAGAAIAELPAWVLVTIEGWRERRQLRREIDDLQRHGELDRTLTDSGIAPSDLTRLLRAHPNTPQQLADMMRRLGMVRAALSGNTAAMTALRAMEWRCGECSNWRKCRAWLASPDTPGSYRAFCANAEALDTLRGAEGSIPPEERGVLHELDAANRE